MRGINVAVLTAIAAMGSVGPAPTSYGYAPSTHREAVLPTKAPAKKREQHKRKNTTPQNRYRRRPNKLWRRVRRKHELGRYGAY